MIYINFLPHRSCSTSPCLLLLNSPNLARVMCRHLFYCLESSLVPPFNFCMVSTNSASKKEKNVYTSSLFGSSCTLLNLLVCRVESSGADTLLAQSAFSSLIKFFASISLLTSPSLVDITILIVANFPNC